jgi:peptidyl-prolyl cis-trans isomerase C
MKYRKRSCLITVTIILFIFSFIACATEEEKKVNITKGTDKSAVKQSLAVEEAPGALSDLLPTIAANVIIDVDGSKLTQTQVDSEIIKKMSAIKGQIPKERVQQARTEIRKQIINDFIIKTLLANEVNRLNISASNQEVLEAVDNLKKSMPQGMTLENLIKKNIMTKEKIYDDIRLGIKINKLVLSQQGAKTKPTDMQISTFYQKNKGKFTAPESVHVRHILIAKAQGDDDKIKAAKRNKAENVRNQLLAGADFAQVAKSYSDCPSKHNGGDLGTFTRGEMVTPFEDAAFAQEKNAIGPVVETAFGFHIIQVLDRIAIKTLSLDETTKAKIASFLQKQKQQEAFESLLKKLKAKANIVRYQN